MQFVNFAGTLATITSKKKRGVCFRRHQLFVSVDLLTRAQIRARIHRSTIWFWTEVSPAAGQRTGGWGAWAARRGAAGRRCSPARRWRRARLETGSGSVGSLRGSPTESGSLETDPLSTAAARRASPGRRGVDTRWATFRKVSGRTTRPHSHPLKPLWIYSVRKI